MSIVEVIEAFHQEAKEQSFSNLTRDLYVLRGLMEAGRVSAALHYIDEYRSDTSVYSDLIQGALRRLIEKEPETNQTPS